MRDLTLSPNARAWAEDLVANAVAALQRPEISAEEAFGTYQALMQNLQPVTWPFLDQAGRVLSGISWGLVGF